MTTNETSPDAQYTSLSHGVYLRNAHGQEILLRPENVTWRTIGGSIDLYFFAGPSQPEVTSKYLDVIGLPTMQQYNKFGCKFSSLIILPLHSLSTTVSRMTMYDLSSLSHGDSISLDTCLRIT